MIIKLSPVRMDEELSVVRSGDVLTLNGEDFDLGQLEEGGTLPQQAITSRWFAGPVDRVEGELLLTLVLPHGAHAPETTRFPQPLTVLSDGAISLPVYDIPEQASMLVIADEEEGK